MSADRVVRVVGIQVDLILPNQTALRTRDGLSATVNYPSPLDVGCASRRTPAEA